MVALQIVSENSETDLARQEAMGQINWALRDLTANLLRVTRGAGKPYEIGPQASALIKAFIAYRDAVGHFPSSEELANVLAAERDPEIMERMSDDSLNRIDAEQTIIRGSLQVVASRLLGQRTQESAGHSEMYDGLRNLEEVRAEQRKKSAPTRTVTKADVKAAIAEARAAVKARSVKSGRKKPKA